MSMIGKSNNVLDESIDHVSDEVGFEPSSFVLLDKPMLEKRLRWGSYSSVAGLVAGIDGTLALVSQKTDTLVMRMAHR